MSMAGMIPFHLNKLNTLESTSSTLTTSPTMAPPQPNPLQDLLTQDMYIGLTFHWPITNQFHRRGSDLVSAESVTIM